MKHEIPLNGCAPTPLAHYLKALGILRLVAEQKDEDAAGRWEGERFVLRSTLDQAALERFFLEEYRPTPAVTPWNGRGGFLEGGEDDEPDEDDESDENEEGSDQGRAGAQMVAEFSGQNGSLSERFSLFQHGLALIRDTKVLRDLDKNRAELKRLKAEEKAKKDRGEKLTDIEKEAIKLKETHVRALKVELLGSLRNELPTEMLPWFDACQILSEKPIPAPLLGAGGLDGSMDFGVNFMQRLRSLFDLQSGKPLTNVSEWLRGALYGDPASTIPQVSIGQFSPGAAGGANATSGFSSKSQANPWDYVLAIEGSLLFASAATRKLESGGASAMSYAFTVQPTGSGNAGLTIADETPKGAKRKTAEIWLPLWQRSATLAEIRTLFSEGRATLGRRPVRDSLDFARAVATLGVDRGIAAFQRYGFYVRAGKAFFAIPLGRMPARRNAQCELIVDLDEWLEGLRKYVRRGKNVPGRIVQLTHAFENALFSLANQGGRSILQEVLTLLGAVEFGCAKSAKIREAVPPLPLLSEAWCLQADDGSDEYRIACALAGLYAPGLPMRAHLVPVEAERDGYKWNPKSRLCVWRSGALTNNLVRVIDRRLLEAERRGYDDKPFDGRAPADLCAVMAFLRGTTDDARIARLVAGLACVRMPEHLPDRGVMPEFVPAAFDVLKPLFVSDGLLQWLGVLRADAKLPLPEQLVALLRAGNDAQSQRAIDLAMRRLRIAGITVPANPRTAPSHGGLNAQRLLCALMIPMDAGDIARLCRRIVPKTDEQAA